jgi:hypothetical protein
LYEKITGEKFLRENITNVAQRIENNCRVFLENFK